MTPSQACDDLNDPSLHIPFKCNPSGQKLCCSISNINYFSSNRFGTCERVMNASTGGVSDSVGGDMPDFGSLFQQANIVQCSYKSSWPSSMTPTKACNDLNDPQRPVSYKCSPSGQKLCCNASSINKFTSSNFGTCQKVINDSNGGDDDHVKPTAKPSRKPTAKPSASSGGIDTNYIHCDWFTFYKDYSVIGACKELNDSTHPVPYLCEDGRKLCCTVSENEHPTFDKFGTCNKF